MILTQRDASGGLPIESATYYMLHNDFNFFLDELLRFIYYHPSNSPGGGAAKVVKSINVEEGISKNSVLVE